ncbi:MULTISPECIES: hypothetical protein [Bacillus cereus group]|uniref:Uncharacterized protein n=1 Tax=Bacillus thuringiensis subsp. tolworthi TaxID=1442 RepID=A0A9W4A8W8_BACTO|nr:MULTISPECIES: hypothetical protein [Bacillus cereus group]MEB8714952.1 hypothetical protein [Bacillus cereus]MEB9590253.1 hypothetical protein [Bacillus cereus]MRC49912.1 hypothetical protein [Bacillus thuringiensis]MRD28249.1 hypothetical protein [Bacillus thuringiensis]BAR85745.1 uncharacterized protein KNN_04902 [Bacillus thuringiensis serovar tolworthi]
MSKSETVIVAENYQKEILLLKKVIAELERQSRKHNRKNVESVQVFVETNCNRRTNKEMKIVDFYKVYKTWCHLVGGMYIFSQAVFRYYLENTLAFQTRRDSDGYVYVLDVALFSIDELLTIEGV